MTADEWAQLARLRGVPDALKAPDLLAPESVKLAAQAPKEKVEAPARKSMQSSFM